MSSYTTGHNEREKSNDFVFAGHDIGTTRVPLHPQTMRQIAKTRVHGKLVARRPECRTIPNITTLGGNAEGDGITLASLFQKDREK